MNIKSLSNKDRYGNMFSVEFFEPETNVPIIMAIPEPEYDHPGDPKGTDTVPAWLTPGEFVMNAEATRKYEPELTKMNNEGREMQQEQGGSIPTYQDNGGYISNLFDKLTLPPAPPGIVYRRMKDGSIGKFTDQKGTRGTKYLGKLQPAKQSKQDRNTFDFSSLYQNKGGSVPPMYAEEGRYVPSNAELHGLYGAETSFGKNIVNREGDGVGPYQIKGSTAIDPGFGITTMFPDLKAAIADGKYANAEAAYQDNKEMVDSVLMDGNQVEPFVSNYLDIAEKELGDRNKAVLSFNQGIPGTRNFKGNAADTNYVSEVNKNKELFSYNMNQKPDMFSSVIGAEASPPNMQQTSAPTVPVIDDEPPVMYGPDIETYRDGSPVPVNKNRIDPEIPTVLAERLAGVRKPPIRRDQYDNLLAQYQQAVKQDEAYKAHTAAESAKTQQANDMVVASEVANIDKQIAENQDNPTLVAALEKKKLQLKSQQTNAQKPVNETTDETEAVSIVEQVIGAAESQEGGLNQPNSSDINSFLLSKGYELKEDGTIGLIDPANEDPEIKGFVGMAQKAMVDAFGDLFSAKELARMALIYTGSRLLGYSHHGSLAYGAKQYIKRVDATQAARQEFVTDKDNLENYTEESLMKYLETGNLSDLVEKTTGYTTRGIGDDIMHQQLGILPTAKIGKDTYGVVYKGTTYPMDHPLMKGKLSKVDPKLDDPTGIEGEFRDSFAQQVKNERNIRGFDEDKLKAFNAEVDSVNLAVQAADLYSKEILLFGRDKNAKRKIRSEMLEAQRDYVKAMARHIENPDKPKPNSLDEYYHKRVVKIKTLNAVPYEMIRTANVQSYSALDKDIKEAVFEASSNPEIRSKMYFQMWDSFVKSWKANSKGSKFDGLMAKSNEENIGHNDFTNWVAHIIDKDRQEGNVAEQNTDGKSTHLLALELLKKE